ncbi:hypothetical protein CYMTET_54014 [Cymbomonas tetramitiformis]|uniref:SET domain-containing protein n=1 Tax=Cymbomonas tetramitiformis TaxID=36881 RepID=A0AAE0BFS2_9CHLO|nr:hypothetical protein CYMTET_54014 [Cymbomonas tetramitiformis]
MAVFLPREVFAELRLSTMFTVGDIVAVKASLFDIIEEPPPLWSHEHFPSWQGNVEIVGTVTDPDVATGAAEGAAVVEMVYRDEIQDENEDWIIEEDDLPHSALRIISNEEYKRAKHGVLYPSPARVEQRVDDVIEILSDDEETVGVSAPGGDPQAAGCAIAETKWAPDQGMRGPVGDSQATQDRMDYGSIPRARVSASQMKINALSHPWPFGAFGELIDNSRDCHASECHVDTYKWDDQWVLFIQDDGPGLCERELWAMLSLGFSNKEASAIGQYGNGFKSSSMRLAKDALVLTCHVTGDSVTGNRVKTFSAGFLSQTLHAEEVMEDWHIPIVAYVQGPGGDLQPASTRDPTWHQSLGAMMQYTPYGTEAELKQRLRSAFEGGGTGTRVELYRLNDMETGLDMETDDKDIRQTSARHTLQTGMQPDPLPFDYSLRAYLRLLYLRPSEPLMRIVLRGEEVPAVHYASSEDQNRCWQLPKKYEYSPKGEAHKVPIFCGLLRSVAGGHAETPQVARREFGVLCYHKGRLIRAYDILPYMEKLSLSMPNVLVVIDEQYLTVSHNKQNYLEMNGNKEFKLCYDAANSRLKQYMVELEEDNLKKKKTNEQHARAREERAQKEMEAVRREAEARLRQVEDGRLGSEKQLMTCCECGKRRYMPHTYECDDEEEWTCSLGHNPTFASCEAPVEEPGMFMPWRRLFVTDKHHGWDYVRKRVTEYAGVRGCWGKGGALKKQKGGTFPKMRFGEVPALAGEAQDKTRKKLIYGFFREAVEAAICEVEGRIMDPASAEWQKKAQALPLSAERDGNGYWGAVVHLLNSWEKDRSTERTKEALKEPLNRHLLESEWVREEDRMVEEYRKHHEQEQPQVEAEVGGSRPAEAPGVSERHGNGASREGAGAGKGAEQRSKSKAAPGRGGAAAGMSGRAGRGGPAVATPSASRGGASGSGARRNPGQGSEALERSTGRAGRGGPTAKSGSLTVTPQQRQQEKLRLARELAAKRKAEQVLELEKQELQKRQRVLDQQERDLRLKQRVADRQDLWQEPPNLHTPQPTPAADRAECGQLAERSPGSGGDLPVEGTDHRCRCRRILTQIEEPAAFFCAECTTWFHPECLGLSLAELRAREDADSDELACADHSKAVVEHRRRAGGQRVGDASCSGASEVAGELSDACPPTLNTPGHSRRRKFRLPPSWPAGAGCIYSSWNVWDNPKSSSERSKRRMIPPRLVHGVEIRRLQPEHPVSCAHEQVHYGLFASRAFDAGERIGTFTGLVRDELNEADSKDYVYGFCMEETNQEQERESEHGSTWLYVDALRVGSELRFINDHRDVAPQPNVHLEHRIRETTGELEVIAHASCNIVIGEELLTRCDNWYPKSSACTIGDHVGDE